MADNFDLIREADLASIQRVLTAHVRADRFVENHFAVGVMMPGLSVLRFAAIPDAVLALVFTALAAQKWVSGSN